MKRLLLMCMMLALGGTAWGQQANVSTYSATTGTGPSTPMATIQCDVDWTSTGTLCGQRVPLSWIRIEQPKPAKQEQKAQPNCGVPINGFVGCGEYLKPLPFDLPAKEWDGPDTKGDSLHEKFPLSTACQSDPRWCSTKMHHVSCQDVAPDWKQRVLLETADGKHHCYNFNLLEKP